LNILLYKGWLRINIFNLLRNFDGHFTVLMNQNTKQYFFRKFGEYHTLTQYIPTDGEYRKLSPEDEDYVNGIIESRLNEFKVTDISDTSIWGNIYDDVMVAVDQLQSTDPRFLNQWGKSKEAV